VDLELVSGPLLMDEAIEDAARTVEVIQDLEEDASGMTPVRVEIRLADGTTRTTSVLDCPGSPTSPLGWDAITGKTAGCARAAGRPTSDIDLLRSWVEGLEGAATVGALPGAVAVTA